jgi:hypothetical protein
MAEGYLLIVFEHKDLTLMGRYTDKCNILTGL